MSEWKLFTDQVIDFEDALRRMVELNRFVGEDEVVIAASDAANHLLVLHQVLVRRGNRVPVVDTGYVLSGTSGSGAGASSVSSGDGATGL